MPDNPDGQIDTATGGEGLAGFSALADDAPTWDDGPWTVHGVALGEDDITEGLADERVYWPRDALEPATEALVGKKIVDDHEHDDLESKQPSVESIVGEVTAAQYEPGVGVTYEGEIDDPDTAKQVERGRIDPSPMVFRRVGDYDEDRDAYPAEKIVHWRDLATVAEGASPSASIQAGAAAMGASALRSAFADGGGDGTGTDDELGDSRSGESGRGADADDEENDMELTDTEEDLVRAARSTDDPTVVPAEQQALAQTADELNLNDFDDPALVESEMHENQQSTIEKIDAFLTDRLAEVGEAKPSEAAAMSVGDKFDRVADDEGEIDADALTQSPEAGGAGDDTDPNDPGGTVTGDALSDGERDEVRNLAKRAETFESIDAEHADSLRSQAADVADVEDFDDIELEAI